MSKIMKIVDFIKTYPNLNTNDVFVDFADDDTNNYSVSPAGTVIVERIPDILGKEIIKMQYNCLILIRRNFIEGLNSLSNAEFIESLQDWVIEQNYLRTTPTFGDDKDMEFVYASNGQLLEINNDSTTALYSIQIAVNYEKHYEYKD